MEENKISQSDLVYHYCSVESFVSILQSSILRLTDVYKMNDWSEKQYYGKLIINYMRDEFNLFEDKIEVLNKRLDDISNPTHGQTLAYACCFSEDADSLSQWKMYGDNGYGMCIGFDKKILSKLNNANNDIISFGKVSYPSSFRRSSLSKSMQNRVSCINESVNGFIGVFDMLMASSIYQKHPSYSSEKEWRIVLTSEKTYCGLISVIDPIDQLNIKSMRYFWRNDYYRISDAKTVTKSQQLRTFYELDFSLVRNKLIKHIIIGPASKNTEVDVYNALMSFGYQNNNEDAMLLSHTRYDGIKSIINVEKSSIPYRG